VALLHLETCVVDELANPESPWQRTDGLVYLEAGYKWHQLSSCGFCTIHLAKPEAELSMGIYETVWKLDALILGIFLFPSRVNVVF
jgi:hypothetical protein